MRCVGRRRSAFTLLEILMVVVILGVLAAVVLPQFFNAHEAASDSSVEMALRRIRVQIELYRAEETGVPDLIATQWGELVDNNYLQQAPINPVNGWRGVESTPGDGVGWVWRADDNGEMQVYATDDAFGEHDEP